MWKYQAIKIFQYYSKLTGLGSIFPDGTLSPGQRKLEWLEEIEYAPANDHIVV